MIRKTIRPLLFPDYDILRMIHLFQEKREMHEFRFDVIIPPITERCYNYKFVILGITFWSILLCISLSRNKKYLYI